MSFSAANWRSSRAAAWHTRCSTWKVGFPACRAYRPIPQADGCALPTKSISFAASIVLISTWLICNMAVLLSRILGIAFRLNLRGRGTQPFGCPSASPIQLEAHREQLPDDDACATTSQNEHGGHDQQNERTNL